MVFFISTLFGTSACRHSVSPTSIVVQDSIRHYYPLLQGEDLNLEFRIANVGDEPLVITEIMPSCGCVVVDEKFDKIILPNKEAKLLFNFKSQKFSGYVKHTIRIFGNIKPKGMALLTFDLHVVPPYDTSPDYEERFRANGDSENGLTPAITSEKQYAIPNEDNVTYTRSYFETKDKGK